MYNCISHLLSEARTPQNPSQSALVLNLPPLLPAHVGRMIESWAKLEQITTPNVQKKDVQNMMYPLVN